MFYNFMNMHCIPGKPEKFPLSLPCAATFNLRLNNVGIYRPLRTANNATFTYICNEMHKICVWNDIHNKTVCYVQHICKKQNFHNGMKSTVTLSKKPMLRRIFLNCMQHTRTCTCTVKSITTKHCSLRYTYRRNCSSTTKIKFTAARHDGLPTIHSPRHLY